MEADEKPVEHRHQIVLAFYRQCIWTRTIKEHFDDLYFSGEKRHKLMDEVASTFFLDLRRLMMEYLILQQCKLTDPAISGKERKNLTTGQILALSWTDETKKRLDEQDRNLQLLREKIISIRHKAIGHLDLQSNLSSNQFNILSEEEEFKFWDHLQEFVRASMSEALPGEPYEINATIQVGNVNSLISHLADAIDYDDLIRGQPEILESRLGMRRYEDA